MSKSTSFSSKKTNLRAVSVRKSITTQQFSFHPNLNKVTKSLSAKRKNKNPVHKKLYKEDRALKKERDRIYTQKK